MAAGWATHMGLIARMIALRTQILLTLAPPSRSGAGQGEPYTFAAALRYKAIHMAGLPGVCLVVAGCRVAK